MWFRLIFAISFFFAFSSIATANSPPAQVEALTQTIRDVPGVTAANLGRINLEGFEVADLSLPGAYGDLPAAALRRSKGGLAKESLLSINFSISANKEGLKALEFLAWWVRDQSRGGENMQLRAIALPPKAAGEIQLGQTLRFTIDWFFISPNEDISETLAALDKARASLNLSLELYKDAF